MLKLLFPNKCILCQKILPKGQLHLCEDCRKNAPKFTKSKRRFPFVARWTSLWYYKDTVSESICRYKFRRVRNYAGSYAVFLAEAVREAFPDGFDHISWVPVSTLRKLHRGYDQAALLAINTAKELSLEAQPLLKKIRNTPPQSGIHGLAQRKANVLGAYRVLDPLQVKGKRILLFDDVITTGATVSECARMLMTAGAKEVFCISVATAVHE